MEPSQALLSYYKALQQSEALPLSLRSTVRHLPFSLTHIWPRIPQDDAFAANVVQSLNQHIQGLLPSDAYGLELVCAGQQYSLPSQHSSVLFYDGRRGVWHNYPAKDFLLWATITLYDEQEWRGLEDVTPEFPSPEDISHLIRWQQQLQQMIARAQAESFESLDAQISLVGLLGAARRLGGSLLICQQKLPSKNEERAIALEAVRHDTRDLHKRVLQAVSRNDLSTDVRQKLWRTLQAMPMPAAARTAVPQLAAASLPKQRVMPQTLEPLASAQKTVQAKPDTLRTFPQKAVIQDRRVSPAASGYRGGTAAAPVISGKATVTPERPVHQASDKIVAKPRIVQRSAMEQGGAAASQLARITPTARKITTGNQSPEVSRVSLPAATAVHEKAPWSGPSRDAPRAIKTADQTQIRTSPAVQEDVRLPRNAEAKIEKSSPVREVSAAASDRKPTKAATLQGDQASIPAQNASPLSKQSLVTEKAAAVVIPVATSPLPETIKPAAIPAPPVTVSNTETKSAELSGQAVPATLTVLPIAEIKQMTAAPQNETVLSAHPPISLEDLWKEPSSKTAEPTASLQEQLEAANVKNISDATCGASCGVPAPAEQSKQETAPTRLMSLIAQQAFRSLEPQKSESAAPPATQLPHHVKKLVLG